MAIDFEALITKHAAEDGTIPAANVAKIVSGISSAVGREFIPRDRYNAKLDEITQLEKDKQDAQDELTKAKKWEDKYTKEHDAFEQYKADTDAKAKLSSVKSAYRALLKDAGIKDDYLDTILLATVYDGMKLTDDGKLENADTLKGDAEKKWAAFKVSTHDKGAPVENPPKDNPGNDANPRAAERAKSYYERRYGKPTDNNNKE